MYLSSLLIGDNCIFGQIDGQLLRPCLADNLVLKNLTVNREHKFLLNVTTRDGETNSSAYSWFIDTIPPTATIHSDQNYTNAEKIYIDVTFSEACTGQGGFKCVNSSNCDVIINGPAQVHAPSLRIMEHGIKYRLNIILSLRSMYGRIVIRMADNFCTDQAGNHFTRSNGSTIIIHFDRRPVLVDLWTSVPSYELVINGVPRTVLATNKMEDITIFLDFSIPIINSTEQILNALHVNSGSLIPIHGKIHGNRRFVFELKKISRTEIVSVELQAGSIIGRTGTPVSSVASITFLYDSTDPGVVLSTSSPNITKEFNINVIVEFMKPVFGFEASMVKVIGGTITRFKELSRALYSLTVLAEAQNMLSVNIPAGKVNDIAGNPNMASNQLEVKQYSTPPISIALHLFVTAGTVATALAAAIISLSSANLGAIGAVASGSTTIFSPDPSMNLHGMIGHLQVFVLSDWLLVNQPIEYSETMKGLQWLIPHQKLPWNRNCPSIWPNHVNLAGKKLAQNLSVLATGWSSHKITNQKIDLNLTNSSYMHHEQPFPIEIDPMSVWLHGQHNISTKDTPYGLPLNSIEYVTYFLRGEPISASNIVKRMKNYKGWQDMEMNLFWLGVGGGSLLTIHVLIIIFLRWRTGIPGHGILSVPRWYNGRDHHWGFAASYPCSLYFISRPTTGRWFYREGLSSSFLLRLGILFESWKGPPLFVFVNQNDPNAILGWTESGSRGIGRMRAISSDDRNEETRSSLSERLLGCAKSSYIILDLLRRVSLGIISGAYSSRKSSQSLFALTITLVQFMYLFTLKPYISRGVQVVESVSLLCEVGIFGLCVSIKSSNPVEAKKVGFVMLSLLFFTFVVQIINEWYGMIKSILRLSQPHKNSFKLGLKFVAKGLVLPFLPRQHWSKVIAATSQPTTGLTPVIPISPETEIERRDRRTPSVHSITSMTATVVPVLSAGQRLGERKKLKEIKHEPKSEMKKLRELAKASFSGDFQGGEASTSYAKAAIPHR
ncbi:hypothetical protein CMV_025262 [Castanea mollissima]|uniref:Bacterial Ig-like domain-containing protein n=1 Tax=Castanea mollissima TaxID=60419 RepID=A0A8J4QEU8_9ROSI|nr:hypothetical protein CMV_025262 [Castanea mollissima]